MMISTDHNPLLQGGGWPIETEPREHKKDRDQAVMYVVRGAERRHRRTEMFTASQRFALKHNLWIAERPSDDVRDTRPSAEKPGLIRVMQLWGCYGGLLVEDLQDFGDFRTQAVIVDRYHRLGRQVVANGEVVPPEKCAGLIARAGGAAAVEELGADLWRNAMRGFMAYMEQDDENVPFLVGSGEPRDYAAACRYAACASLCDAGRTEILGRLNLDGYLNEHKRRRWHTRNYPVGRS